ncbi:MAG: PilZ domain-containing protein [Thiogranum sp.]
MSAPERRKHVRTAFTADVRLVHASVGTLDVKMRDLSDGGVFLLTADSVDLPPGERVEIRALDVEGAPVLSARVVRRDSTGIALILSDD